MWRLARVGKGAVLNEQCVGGAENRSHKLVVNNFNDTYYFALIDPKLPMSSDDEFSASEHTPLWTSPSMLTAAGLAAGALLSRGSMSRVALALAAGSLAWRSYSKTKPKPPSTVEASEETASIMPEPELVHSEPAPVDSEPMTELEPPAPPCDFVAEAFAKVDAQQAQWDADPQMQQFTRKTGPITGRLQAAVVEEEPVSSLYYPSPERQETNDYTPLQLASEPRMPSAPIVSGNHPLLAHVFTPADQVVPTTASPLPLASAPLLPQTPSAPLMPGVGYTELPPLQTPLTAATAPAASPISRPLAEPFLVIEETAASAEPVSPLFTLAHSSRPLSGPMPYQPPQSAIEGSFLHVPAPAPATSPVQPVQPITNALTNLLPRAATPTALLHEIPAFHQPSQPTEQPAASTTTELKIRPRELEQTHVIMPGLKPLSVPQQEPSAPLPPQDQTEPTGKETSPEEAPPPQQDETPSGPIKKQWLGWWK
jgi:hypothetical protein